MRYQCILHVYMYILHVYMYKILYMKILSLQKDTVSEDTDSIFYM